MLNLILDICNSSFNFESFTEIDSYFKRIINVLKQMNYSEYKSEKFNNFQKELLNIIDEKKAA